MIILEKKEDREGLPPKTGVCTYRLLYPLLRCDHRTVRNFSMMAASTQ